MVPYIPLELAEAVIDHLSDSHPDLRACSLVCRHWLPRSRVHLFREIHFGKKEDLYSLTRLLKAEPTLPPLILSVTQSFSESEHNHVVPLLLLTGLPNLTAWRFIGPAASKLLDFKFNARSLSGFRKYATNIQELHISNICFGSCAELGRLILSFVGLRVLHCAALRLEKRGTLDVVKERISRSSSLYSLSVCAFELH